MFSENRIAKPTSELYTIQRLVARIWTATYPGMPTAEIAKLLDDVQYLLSLPLDVQGDSTEFHAYIKDIEAQYPGFEGLSIADQEIVLSKQ